MAYRDYTRAPKITNPNIRRALERKDPSMLPTLCVLKDMEKSLITYERHAVWYAITYPDRKHTVPIDKETALSLIALLGLERKVHTKDGSVYDTPNGDWKRKYKDSTIKLD